MNNNFSKAPFNVSFHIQLMKTLLVITNIAAFIIYFSLHIILWDFPFEATTEVSTLIKLCGIACAFALSICLVVLLADAVDLVMLTRKKFMIPIHAKIIATGLIVIAVLLTGCGTAPINAGIKKDFNTGMSSRYTGMEPEKVLLVMNNEILNHTDIPIGESFLVVNDGIKGLQVKNGKVKIGCTLSVTDQKGKILLSENDLFAGHDEFDEKEAKMLKCTVNTGEPMQWEEKYDVAVTFWDKNGTGKIENKVTIKSIDMP